jgi:anion-transporting  ArsA/GET3 family ATPase
VAGVAVQTFLRTVGKVVGSEVVDDIVAFFRAFEGMEQGFRERAASVTTLLADADTSFVLVTSPRRDAVEEAEFFAKRLRESGLAVGALVVNRVHPDFGEADDAPRLRARAAELRTQASNGGASDVTEAARRLAERSSNLADYAELSWRERSQLSGVGDRIGAGVVAYVPSLSHDVVDFTALDTVAQHLLGSSRSAPEARK